MYSDDGWMLWIVALLVLSMQEKCAELFIVHNGDITIT